MIEKITYLYLNVNAIRQSPTLGRIRGIGFCDLLSPISGIQIPDVKVELTLPASRRNIAATMLNRAGYRHEGEFTLPPLKPIPGKSWIVSDQAPSSVHFSRREEKFECSSHDK